MRVSQQYELGLRQSQLGFVDVDIARDTRLFIDPHAVRMSPTPWAQACVSLIRSFFTEVLAAVRAKDYPRADRLLGGLREPNETHLGLSKGRSRGRGMGPVLARELRLALSESKALESGLLVDLEDTALLVEGISYDRVSDIATNLIRAPLIAYTQEVADRHGIRLQDDVESGPLWDPDIREWTDGDLVRLPMTKQGRLLLVPKVFVRKVPDYDVNEYLDDYIVSYLSYRELANPMSSLVVLLKGAPHVYKKDLIKRYLSGHRKEAVVQITQQNPEVLRRFKADKDEHPSAPLENHELAELVGAKEPDDCQQLLDRVRAVPVGTKGATEFEDAVGQLLACLFSPGLEFLERQVELNEGRKRVDLTYQNWDGEDTFFGYLLKHNVPSMNIFIECKNYSDDPDNPAIDQLLGRFDKEWNRFGFLICPTVKDRARMDARCRDAALKKNEYVIVLDHADLEALVTAKARGGSRAVGVWLADRFNRLIR